MMVQRGEGGIPPYCGPRIPQESVQELLLKMKRDSNHTEIMKRYDSVVIVEEILRRGDALTKDHLRQLLTCLAASKRAASVDAPNQMVPIKVNQMIFKLSRSVFSDLFKAALADLSPEDHSTLGLAHSSGLDAADAAVRNLPSFTAVIKSGHSEGIIQPQDRSLWIPSTVLKKGTGCEVHDALEHASRSTGTDCLAARAGYSRVDERSAVTMAVRLLRSNGGIRTGNELDLVGSLEVVLWLLDHWPHLDVMGTVELAPRQLVPALIKAAGASTMTWRKVQKIFASFLDRVPPEAPSSSALDKLWSLGLSKICNAVCNGWPEDRLCAVRIILDILRTSSRLPRYFVEGVIEGWRTDEALPALMEASDSADSRDTGAAIRSAASDALCLIRDHIGAAAFEDLSLLYAQPRRVPTAGRTDPASSRPTSRARYLLGTGSSLSDRLAIAAQQQYGGGKSSLFRNVGNSILASRNGTGQLGSAQPYPLPAVGQRPPSNASGSNYSCPAKLGPASRASTRSGSGVGVFSQESPIAGRPRLPSRRVLSAGDHGRLAMHLDGCGSDASSVISGNGCAPRPLRRTRPAAGLTEGEPSLLETIKSSEGGASSEVSTARDAKAVVEEDNL
ncbi:hypothetical protein FOL47_010563 [Perkinsus chesapeaki]|uniref:Uncharacterized protein n=1 Tax=Perkinsus chesapeaki TaxID=330153 RepID=A0A7J6L2I0_PERCH|nr:hypothetical protein FOL47_010563 [Perkinsus chesapeaki]